MAEKKVKPATDAKQATDKKVAEKKPVAEKKVVEKKPAATEKPVENKEKAAKPSAVKTYHISFRKDANKWQVKATNSDKALRLFNTQAEAIEFARKTAENQDVSIVIHKETGAFRKQKY